MIVRRSNSSQIASIGIIADNPNALANFGIGGSSRGPIEANATIIETTGQNANGIVLKAMGQDVMRITMDGKVGVGSTSASQHTLDVSYPFC